MKVTISELQKKIKQLTAELNSLFAQEQKGTFFVASINEDPKTVKPDFNLQEATASELVLISMISSYKHVLNEFNQNTRLESIANHPTIDQVLVQLPVMNEIQKRYTTYTDFLGREREPRGFGPTSVPEYKYANFDRTKVLAFYEANQKVIQDIQLELDRINATHTVDIP